MEPSGPEGNGAHNGLQAPSSDVPSNDVPGQVEEINAPAPPKKKAARVPIARRGLGSKGQKIALLTNHFKVNVTNVDGQFFHYSVRTMFYFCTLLL